MSLIRLLETLSDNIERITNPNGDSTFSEQSQKRGEKIHEAKFKTIVPGTNKTLEQLKTSKSAYIAPVMRLPAKKLGEFHSSTMPGSSTTENRQAVGGTQQPPPDHAPGEINLGYKRLKELGWDTPAVKVTDSKQPVKNPATSLKKR